MRVEPLEVGRMGVLGVVDDPRGSRSGTFERVERLDPLEAPVRGG